MAVRHDQTGSEPRPQPRRLLLATLLVTTFAPIAAVPWYYARQRDAIDAATARQLHALADAQAEQVRNWRLERMGDGNVLASRSLMRTAKRALASTVIGDEDREDLLDVMRHMERSFLYTGAALIDGQGTARVESTPRVRATANPWMPGLTAAAPGRIALSDLYREPDTGRALIALVVPVEGEGAFVLEIDASRFLYPYLQARTALSQTGETFLVGERGDAYLSPLRHASGAAADRQQAVDLPLRQALTAPAGAPLTWRDYRGVPVIGVVRRITDSPWYLVSKIDEDEVYAPLRRLAWEIALGLTLMALANGAVVALVWRNQQLRTYREREAWFRAILDDTPAYLWMADPSDGNSFMNKPLQIFVGEENEALGHTWIETVHPDDRPQARAHFSQAAAERRPYRDEFRVRRFDGEDRWVICDGVPRFAADGTFLGYAGALVDISERKRTEQQVQALSARLIHSQEEERTRIARELHDDLSQQLTVVSIALSNLTRTIAVESETARAQADRIQRKLVDLAEGMRRISHQLHPAALTLAGLDHTLRAHCREFTKLTGVEVTFTSHGSFEGASPSAVLCLFRISQEALQNVARHAGVREATVELTRGAGVMRLVVADRGAGIDAQQPHRADGLGLVSIRERTRLCNGRCEIRSEPERGTTIIVELPEPSAVEADTASAGTVS